MIQQTTSQAFEAYREKLIEDIDQYIEKVKKLSGIWKRLLPISNEQEIYSFQELIEQRFQGNGKGLSIRIANEGGMELHKNTRKVLKEKKQAIQSKNSLLSPLDELWDLSSILLTEYEEYIKTLLEHIPTIKRHCVSEEAYQDFQAKESQLQRTIKGAQKTILGTSKTPIRPESSLTKAQCDKSPDKPFHLNNHSQATEAYAKAATLVNNDTIQSPFQSTQASQPIWVQRLRPSQLPNSLQGNAPKAHPTFFASTLPRPSISK
jgi:hypothetical protein